MRKKIKIQKHSSQRAKPLEPFWTFPPLSLPCCLHPPPFLLTRIMFHFRCNPPPSSLPSLPVISFCLCSVPLSACVRCYQCSRTPPLTDNSLDATLLCTVQCTAILPQWALDQCWMDRIGSPPRLWVVPARRGGEGGSRQSRCPGSPTIRADCTICSSRK